MSEETPIPPNEESLTIRADEALFALAQEVGYSESEQEALALLNRLDALDISVQTALREGQNDELHSLMQEIFGPLGYEALGKTADELFEEYRYLNYLNDQTSNRHIRNSIRDMAVLRSVGKDNLSQWDRRAVLLCPWKFGRSALHIGEEAVQFTQRKSPLPFDHNPNEGMIAEIIGASGSGKGTGAEALKELEDNRVVMIDNDAARFHIFGALVKQEELRAKPTPPGDEEMHSLMYRPPMHAIFFLSMNYIAERLKQSGYTVCIARTPAPANTYSPDRQYVFYDHWDDRFRHDQVAGHEEENGPALSQLTATRTLSDQALPDLVSYDFNTMQPHVVHVPEGPCTNQLRNLVHIPDHAIMFENPSIQDVSDPQALQNQKALFLETFFQVAPHLRQ